MFPASLLDGLAPDLLWRVGLSFVAGAVLGVERERRGRAAGLRTTLLLTLAACLAMVVSEHYYRASFREAGATWHPDPLRLGAGLLSGMGFLGAGVIVHLRRDITRGVTTAAALWFATVIGLCFGAGVHGAGLLVTLLALVTLWWVPRFESRIHHDRFGEVTVIGSLAAASLDELGAVIERHGLKIKHLDWREDLDADARKVRFEVKFRRKGTLGLPQELVRALSALPGIRAVNWRG